ncbi:ISAs1 family transposase [Dictyobacter formicarum]|uniref:ISAs1 family transposase n=1 Tax=Dictyobacter formicarum TaxID=2778368 RepID=A0ABQ3V9N3_9CHLR|nr:ISAs1 family transposase [Dictyobacter formicarum]GHO82494.1 hypothetical protein KSZ_05000 [Dictyobacter formicarum]
MDYTTLKLETRTRELPEQEALTSLYEALQRLPDPRRAQGKRYSLAFVITMVLLAKLSGAKNLSAVTDWARHQKEVLHRSFGVSHSRMPCQNTYRSVLTCIDAQCLDEILADFFGRWEAQSRCGNEPSRLQTPQGQADHRHLAIDGKTIRATTDEPFPVHQLSCYEVTTGRVLWHRNVQQKQNEISALAPLLTTATVKGRILSADAMHTQRDFCARVTRLGGDYLLVAKDNQPSLHEDIADLFEDAKPDQRRWQRAKSWDKGHGRLEHREIVCSPDLNEWFAKTWEGIEQVFRLERTVTTLKTGVVHHEIVYGLSSLRLQEASASKILALARAH